MALKLGDRVLDNGLSALDTEADKIYVCSALPTTYTEATSTYALGNKNWGAGNAFGAPAANTPTGRKTTSVAITDGSVTANGTVSHWAAVDSANSRLLASDVVTGGAAVTSGQQFTLASFAVQMSGAAAGGAFTGPGDVVTFNSWWGLRAYSAAYAAPGNNPAIDICDSSGANTQTINILSTGALDVAAVSTWVGSHGSPFVSKVYDQVGTNHFLQVAAAQNPALTLNADGALPGITFTASSTQTLLTAGVPLNGLTVFTFSGVVNHTNAASGQQAIVGTGSLRPLFAFNVTAIDVLSTYMAGGILNQTAANNAVNSAQGVFNTTASYSIVNGSNATGDIGSSSGSTEGLGLGSASNATRYFDGIIFEVGMVLSALTVGASSQTDNLYLNQKAYWGTP